MVEIDLDTVRLACEIETHELLRIAAVWRSPGTALRGALTTQDINGPLTGIRQFRLQAVVDGHQLGGQLRIETHLLLTTNRRSASVISPTRAGSIIWRDVIATVVEGDAPRFPVEVADFSLTLGVPADAVWFLSWNSDDMHQPFLGAVRLMINTGVPAVVEAVAGGGRDPRSKAIRSAIYYEVGRALIRGALSNDEFLSAPDSFPDGSVGHSLSTLLRIHFSTYTVYGVKHLLDERPRYFDSVLQGKLKLFTE
jgi:hypothetical protein